MYSMKGIRGIGLACFVGVILLAFDYVSSSRFFNAQDYSSSGGSIRVSKSDTISIMNDSGTRLESLFEGIASGPRFASRVAAFARCAKESGNPVSLLSKLFQLQSVYAIDCGDGQQACGGAWMQESQQSCGGDCGGGTYMVPMGGGTQSGRGSRLTGIMVCPANDSSGWCACQEVLCWL